MTTTPALGALAQASDALTRAIAAPQSGAEVAVATTIDIAILIFGPIIGACVGAILSVIFSVLSRRAFAKSATASSILARVRRPGHFTFAAWGAWAGLGIALVNPHLSDWNGTSITTFLMHVLLIVALACLTWMVYAAAWVFEDAAKARQDSDKGRSRRFETQAQVLRRLSQSVVVVVGVVAIIGTFEVARHAMTTVLASAGVISVIVGLAAQQTLGNVFAGLQLAFTDAIRVGDVVVADEKKETGSVEEITLSYVVVRIWDERRLIIPCRYFTQTPFENWTRRAAAQLGTVELKLDWTAPMALIRSKVEQLLNSTDLWDGRTWGVQVADSDENTVTVRILVSAKSSGTLSDLRAFLREQLISWIVTEEPWARPAQRVEPRQTVTVEQDMSRERVARLAAELAGISGANEAGTAPPPRCADENEDCVAGVPATGGAASASSGSAVTPQLKDPAHAVRMVAARRKAKRARRRAMAERQRELAEGGSVHDETQVISKSALRKIIEAAGNANPQLTQTLTAISVGRGERFFSGSADADERAAAFEGPGEDVYAEREAEVRRARERRDSRKRREGEALDPETTLALAAVGVEPVEANESSDTVSLESPSGADVSAEDADAPARADAAPIEVPTPEAVSDEQLTKASKEPAAADDHAVHTLKDAATVATEHTAETTTDAHKTDDADEPQREDASPSDQPEGADPQEDPASLSAEISPDDQETTPIPARETSVKNPVQVPPPERTGRPVMTDTVQAITPALVPPPAPTPAEMAASRTDADESDEPTVHPGWYEVAEEARLDAETHPTPTVTPERVSIMDFFPAVGREEPKAADPVATEKTTADGGEAGEAPASRAPTGASPEAATEGEPTADSELTADSEATTVMNPVDAAQAGALDLDATQVLPARAEVVDETLVMPAAVDVPTDKADKPSGDVERPTEEASPVVEASAKKAPAKKASTKKAPGKKAATKKASSAKTSIAKKSAKKSASAAKRTAKDEQVSADKASETTPAKGAEASAKKAATKKSAPKKTNAKKVAAKKDEVKKNSSSGPTTGE